jgi:hypothetical protein
MNHATTGDKRSRLILAGVFAVILVSIVSACALFFALRSRRQPDPPIQGAMSALYDKLLGIDSMDEIEEEGFHALETTHIWKDESFRWTNGAAKLVVPLGERPPRALFVRLGLTAPRLVQLRILVNGKPLFDEKFTMTNDWTRTFDVSDLKLGKAMTIEIFSDTVVPSDSDIHSDDGRSLGVAMRGVMLMSDEQDFANVLVGAKSVVGVAEEGMHGQEYADEQPFRWTNGAAKLTVPIGRDAPKALALVCGVPHRPDFRVEVKVNGQSLFNEVVLAKGDWTVELPLHGVNLAREARIELTTSTVVPLQSGTGSKDGRTLGIRLKRLMLVR